MAGTLTQREADRAPVVRDGIANTNALRLRSCPGRLSAMLTRIASTEFAAVAVASYIASVIYNWNILGRWPPAHEYVPAALFVALAVLLVALGFRHFAVANAQQRHRFLWNGIGAVAVAFSFFLSALFLFKWADDYSRGTYFFQLIATAIAVLSVRAIGHSRMQSAIAHGRVEARRAVLIGGAFHCQKLAARLRDAGIHTVGAFELAVDGAGRPIVGNGGRLGGTSVQKLVDFCRTSPPDDVIVLPTAEQFGVVPYLADAIAKVPVSLHVVPQGATDLLASSRLADLGSIATIQVLHPPLSSVDQSIKRAFDLVVASAGLVFMLPLLAVIAVLIKLDSRGPVLFQQNRHGYNNKQISVFKFRTMHIVEDGADFTQAIRNDPRVTRMGRLLRSTSIDELPQLLNVLSGEMSVVGPRPHPVALNTTFEAQIAPFSRRHNVKPGITGWAQVNGYRGETDTLEKMQRRVDYDLYYIDNWSFLFDLKIILMTLFSRKVYENAH